MTVYRSTLAQYRLFIMGGLLLMLIAAMVHVMVWPDIRDIIQEIMNIVFSNKYLNQMVLHFSAVKSGEKFQAYTGLRWGLVHLNFMSVLVGVCAGMGLLAGEEEKGTLGLLLSRPITRTRLVLEKFAAAATGVFVIMVPSTLALYGMAGWIEDEISFVRLLGCASLFFMHTMIYTSIALLFSVVCSRQLAAAGWAISFAILFFAMAAFDFCEPASPFHYTGFWTLQSQFSQSWQPWTRVFFPRTLLADGLLIAVLLGWSCRLLEKRSW